MENIDLPIPRAVAIEIMRWKIRSMQTQIFVYAASIIFAGLVAFGLPDVFGERIEVPGSLLLALQVALQVLTVAFGSIGAIAITINMYSIHEQKKELCRVLAESPE